MIKKIWVYFRHLFFTGVIFALLVLLSTVVVSPSNKTAEPKYDPNLIAAVQESRKTIIDVCSPPVFYRQVDYNEGENGQDFGI